MNPLAWLSGIISPRMLLVLAAVVALGAAYLKGRSDGAAPARAQMAAKEAAWSDERTKAQERANDALQAEINAHNATRNELDVIHANAQADRAVAASAAASAADALAASDRGARRLRDALETHRLATRAALDAANSAGQCEAATTAADLYSELLSRYRERARRLGDAGRAVSDFAERESAAARECASSADAMIKASGKVAAPP